MDCQQDLLRVLNDGCYNRVGDTKQLYSDFQIIFASTKDLEDEVEKGTVLLDLMSRIIGATITLQSLRERKDDIEDLIKIFFAKRGTKIENEAFDALVRKCKSLYWQGNIRMLYQALSVMEMNSKLDGKGCSVDFLPDLKLMHPPSKSTTEGFDDIVDDAINNGLSLEEAVQAFERSLLDKAIKKSTTITEATKRLNLSRSTMDFKRRKYQLD